MASARFLAHSLALSEFLWRLVAILFARDFRDFTTSVRQTSRQSSQGWNTSTAAARDTPAGTRKQIRKQPAAAVFITTSYG